MRSSGLLVMKALPRSAANSRYRERARMRRVETSHTTTATIPAMSQGFPSLRPPVREKRKAFCIMMAATMAMKEAMVRVRTSRFFTWESSWARTASRLLRREEPHDGVRHRDHGVARAPARGKGIGDRRLDNGDLWFGNVYLRCKPADHGMETRGIMFIDDARLRGPEDKLIGEEGTGQRQGHLR